MPLTPLIIDCDPGNGIPGANVDDALALALAWSAPNLEVKSVWTVFGNVSASEGSAAARRIAQTMGVHTPIISGCDVPLTGEKQRRIWREKLCRPRLDPDPEGLWQGADRSLCETRRPAADGAAGADSAPARAAARLADDVFRHCAGGRVTVVCLGPLTNIAAMLRYEPRVAGHIREIRLMGGCLGYGDLVDTNFAVDPAAVASVFDSGIDLTVVPLDVTRTTCLSAECWQRIVARAERKGAEAARRAREIDVWLRPWLTYSSRTRPVDGMWLHDMVVVADLIAPGLVHHTRKRVSLAHSPAGKLLCAQSVPSPARADIPGRENAVKREEKTYDIVCADAVDNEGLTELWAQTVLGVPALSGTPKTSA